MSARNTSKWVGSSGLGGVGGGRATWRARRARASPPPPGRAKRAALNGAPTSTAPRRQRRPWGLNRHPRGEHDECPDSSATQPCQTGLWPVTGPRSEGGAHHGPLSAATCAPPKAPPPPCRRPASPFAGVRVGEATNPGPLREDSSWRAAGAAPPQAPGTPPASHASHAGSEWSQRPEQLPGADAGPELARRPRLVLRAAPGEGPRWDALLAAAAAPTQMDTDAAEEDPAREPPRAEPGEDELPSPPSSESDGGATESSDTDFSETATTATSDAEDLADQVLNPVASPTVFPEAAWKQLDEIHLAGEARVRVPTLQSVPPFMRGAVRSAFACALRRLDATRGRPGADHERAWKLFLLIPRLLLFTPEAAGRAGRREFDERVAKWSRGDFKGLLAQAHARGKGHQKGFPDKAASDEPMPKEELKRRATAAHKQVQLGQLRRGRQALTAPALAPKTEETFTQLTDPARRPPTLTAPLPDGVSSLRPQAPIQLDRALFASSARSLGKGLAKDALGTSNEHVKVMLDDPVTTDMWCNAAAQLARGEVPEPVARGIAIGRMTALDKGEGKVRGIVTGNCFRRLVAKTLAKQLASQIEEATAPFQFALSARAGTDALGHLLRATSGLDPDAVIIAIDGVGAFDHILRREIFNGLLDDPSLSPLVPFVRLFYGEPSEYLWEDSDGNARPVQQGEGGEQGDPLMPALFAIGLHRALLATKACLPANEWLGAFLDDVYLVTTRASASAAFGSVAASLKTHAGIDVNMGKCRVWSKTGGEAPPGISELGPDVWRGDREPEENGLIVLGAPLGNDEFVKAFAMKRRREEQLFLDRLLHVPDLQSAWLLLLFCAAARANHMLRLLPPTASEEYAISHDAAVWQALCELLAQERLKESAGPLAQRTRHLATLPGRMGGLGLHSAARSAHGAYWASWIDALPVMSARAPAMVARIVGALRDEASQPPECLAEARDAAARLIGEGLEDPPTWEQALQGAHPPKGQGTVEEPGIGFHGWQYHACCATYTTFSQHHFQPSLGPRHRALLHSQSGPLAARAFTALPTMPATRSRPERFQVILRRRLWLSLPLAPRRCPGRTCRAYLDRHGHHLAACPRTGLLKRRSRPIERAWAQVFREAGASSKHFWYILSLRFARLKIYQKRESF